MTTRCTFLFLLFITAFLVGLYIFVQSVGPSSFFDPLPRTELRAISGREAARLIPTFWPAEIPAELVEGVYYYHEPSIDSNATIFRANLSEEAAALWATHSEEKIKAFARELAGQGERSNFKRTSIARLSGKLVASKPRWWSPRAGLHGSWSQVELSEDGRVLETLIHAFDRESRTYWQYSESSR